MASGVRVYKEGILQKRARGLHTKRNIKWQERYCRLTSISLDYYDPKKMNEPKGQFKLEQIRIVEVVSQGLFDKLKGNPFQVGDYSEVMYFATKTPQERNEWMDACRLAAHEKNSQMLMKHHPGVYGLKSKDRWSCCGNPLREVDGCREAFGTLKALGDRMRSQTSPLEFINPENISSFGPESKDDLTGSTHSDASDSTLTEQQQGEEPGMFRSFSVSVGGQKRPKPLIKPKIDRLSESPENPEVKTPEPIMEENEKEEKMKDEKENHCMSNVIPLQLEDLSRSGASSPAWSTDSGRGTSSRPGSMITTEGENLPSTPQSTRSHITTITTDSDPNKNNSKRTMDSQSILSDTSGLSGYSGTSPIPLHLKKRMRPSSVVYKDGVAFSVSEVSMTSAETNAGEVMMKLHQACRDGNLDLVKDELDTGAPIGDQEIFNGVPMLPLFISFLHDHRHIMIYLLEHGADPNAVDMTTRSCLLHWACQRGCIDIVEMLIKYKADINMRSHEDNTPLCEASRNGHSNVVELLLDRNAIIDFEGGLKYTPLHYAASAGHSEIVKILLQRGANPMKKTLTNETPYHLAFKNDKTDVLKLLYDALSTRHKPYDFRESIEVPSEQVITSLTFISSNQSDEKEMKLVAGSRDCLTRIFNVDEEGLTQSKELRLGNTILSVASNSPFVAMGSTFIQVADVITESGWRRTVADDSSEDESLENPPLHLVSFTPDGHLVTAGVESNDVKIWPSINPDSVISQPLTIYHPKEEKDEAGTIFRLEVSPNIDAPWLAVVMQPGLLLSPEGNKKVHVYNMKEGKVYHIINTGYGGITVGVHITFSMDGMYLLIACKDKLTKWVASTGDLILSTSLEKGSEVTCLTASPDGYHIAVGLKSGDTLLMDIETGLLAFPLRNESDRSAVTALSYSPCGTYLATGHHRGSIQLWDVHKAPEHTT